MDRFWPGGLTLIFRKMPEVPVWLTAGGDGIAVRVPDHPIALALIRAFGKPVIGTSANLSGSPSISTAEGVREQLGDAVDFILDDGVCLGGVSSTVLDLTGQTPVILREGAVSREDIARAGVAFGVAD